MSLEPDGKRAERKCSPLFTAGVDRIKKARHFAGLGIVVTFLNKKKSRDLSPAQKWYMTSKK